MDRCDLIELFKNYCVPYGQRKYRDSGRGKVLNKTRRSPDPPPKLNILNHNRGRKMSIDGSERLKPPPDLLSGHMKRIKLENPIHSEDTYCKRKMSVDSVSILHSRLLPFHSLSNLSGLMEKTIKNLFNIPVEAI